MRHAITFLLLASQLFSGSGTVMSTTSIRSADSEPGYKDTEVGTTRIKHIEERLRAASCPWTSDGAVMGWWNGEQPGVELRQWSGNTGHAVADFHQGPYGMGGNAVNDARFAAHACADIQFLLDHRELKKERP